MINRNFFDKRYYFEDGIVVEVIEEKGFDEVDRSKHSTALLGRSYELNTTVRKDIVAEQIDNLKNPPVVPKRKDDSIPDVPDIEFHEADRGIAAPDDEQNKRPVEYADESLALRFTAQHKEDNYALENLGHRGRNLQRTLQEPPALNQHRKEKGDNNRRERVQLRKPGRNHRSKTEAA